MSQYIRNTVYLRVVDALQAGDSVVVCGTRLSGKSSIVDRLRTESDVRLRPRLTIRGLDRATVPLQAVRFALAALGFDATGSEAELFTLLCRAIEDDFGILVVEDADRMDDDSLFFIEQAVCHLRRPCLITTSLLDSQLVRRGRGVFSASPHLELRPVGIEDATALLSTELDGIPGMVETSRFLAKSGGVPGILVEMTGEAVRAGILGEVGGVWKFRRRLWEPLAEDASLSLLDGLTDAERQDLTRLALLGRLDGEVAERITDHDRLVTLERSGLLYRGAGGEGEEWFRVNVQPEILAVHLRRKVGLFQRRRLFAELSAALPDRSLKPSAAAYDEERNDGPYIVNPDIGSTYLAATIQHDLQAVLTVHLEQWRHRRSTRDAIDLLDLMIARGQHRDDIRNLFDEVRRLPVDDMRARVVFALREARWLAWMDDDLTTALTRLDELRAETGSEYSLVISAIVDHLRTVGGIADQPDQFWPTFLRLEHPTITTALESISTGRHSEDAVAMAWNPTGPEPSANLATYVRLLSMIRYGSLAEAVQFANDSLTAAIERQDPEAVVLTTNALATALMLLGRLTEANSALSNALALGYPAFPYTPIHVSNLVMLSILQARRGLRARAWTTYQQAMTIGVKYAPFAFAAPDLAAAFIDYYDEAPGAGDRIWTVCLALIDRGYTAAAMCGWAFAGPWSAEQNDIIAGLVPADSEPLFGPLLKLHRAVSANTKRELEESCRELAELGRNLFAATAAVHRARLADAGRDEYTEWMDTARELTRSIGLGSYEATLLASRIRRLSNREREIFDLLVSGESNQDIADRLVLTIRTVENHVFRLLKKLELRSRLEVAEYWNELSD